MSAAGTALSARSGRRRRLALLLLVLACAGGGLTWWAWSGLGGPERPAVPDVPLGGVEPVVARAVTRAREAVLREPGSGAAWGRLGEVLLANGFDRPALDCLAEAEWLDGKNPRWPYLQAWRLLVLDREKGIPPLRRAVQLCDKSDPKNTTPRLLLAEALIEKDERDEAEAVLRRVLTRDPANPRAHFSMALVALARDDAATAEGHLRQAAESPFTRQKAAAQLAAVCERLGKKDDAARFGRLASELPEDQPWNDPYVLDYQRRASGRQEKFLEAEQLEREGRLPEGVRLLYRVAEEYPDGRSHVALGVALAKMNDLEAAERSLRSALRLAPDKVNAQFALSVVLYKQGEQRRKQGDREAAASRFREAADWARKATGLKPDHAFAHIYRGLALSELGKRAEAIQAFRTAARCRPELVDAHLHLGEALAEDGHKVGALAALRTAVDLARKDDDRPRATLARLRAEGKVP